jgi:glycosyltransferase involved in cell wall biosynthesis
MMPIPITIAIPVKDEERNLGRCLARLDQFARVVVIDSHSTDQTQAIARAYGAEVVQFDWNGRYPKKRNWFLANCPIDTDWVLFLDADELIDAAFCDAVRAAIADTSHQGFWLNYTNHFLGKAIRHGIAQRKLALFRVGSIFYEQIEELAWSALDMEIHEHPIIQGSVGEIAARIDHDDYRGIAKFIDRHRNYAMWEARRYQALTVAKNDGSDFSPRQRRKYRHLAAWWFPWAYFALTYFVKLGFLDGRAGFLLAFYKTWYFTSIGVLIREDRSRR